MKDTEASRFAHTVQEVIDLTEISRPIIYKKIRSGELPTTLIGGQRFILAKDLRDFLRRPIVRIRSKSTAEVS